MEEQQNGQDRAKYGARVIEKLSEALTNEFGRGFSRETLKNCRRFYLEYKNRIGETLFTLFAVEKSQTVFTQLNDTRPFVLSWSHYLILMRIKSEDERSFYERSKLPRVSGMSALYSGNTRLPFMNVFFLVLIKKK